VAFACTRGVVTGGLGASESDIALSPDPNTGQAFEGMTQEQHFGTLQVDYEVANGTLTYLAGFMNNTSTDHSDSDYTDFEVNDPMAFSLSANNYFKFDFEHIVQELRHVGSKGRWQWSAGVASYFETAQLDNGATFWLRNPNSFLAGPPFFIPTESDPGVKPINPQERETEHYSAFLSLAYEISDQWTVAVEGRYSRDDIEYTVPTWTRQQVSLLGQTPLDICPVTADDRDVPQTQKYPNVPYDCFVSDSVNTSVFTPRVLVEYQPTPDAMYYASVTRGFTPGGFAALEAIELSTQRYEEETVTAFELGAKTRLLNNRMQLNGALFFNDYKDQQIGVQQTPPGSFTPIGGITNAGRVHVYGAEVDALYDVTDNLRLQLAYAYTHAEFDEFIQTDVGSSALNKTEAGNEEADFSGNMVGKSPEHAFNMDVDYRNRIEGTRYNWFAGGTALYRSKRYFDESNLAYMPDYWRVNLRAGIENSRYQVIAFVDNALDDDTILTGQRAVSLGHPDGFAPGRGYLVHLPAPRTYGVRLQANF
jgi:outer membrane receptor protein involved in Fe transport